MPATRSSAEESLRRSGDRVVVTALLGAALFLGGSVLHSCWGGLGTAREAVTLGATAVGGVLLFAAFALGSLRTRRMRRRLLALAPGIAEALSLDVVEQGLRLEGARDGRAITVTWWSRGTGLYGRAPVTLVRAIIEPWLGVSLNLSTPERRVTPTRLKHWGDPPVYIGGGDANACRPTLETLRSEIRAAAAPLMRGVADPSLRVELEVDRSSVQLALVDQRYDYVTSTETLREALERVTLLAHVLERAFGRPESTSTEAAPRVQATRDASVRSRTS